MAYTKYSLTPANNNAAPPDGAPEGMLPSAVNDTMRDMMAQIRDVGDGIRGGTYTMTAPVITGGSITGVALSGNTLTNPVVSGGTITNATITGGSVSGITDLAIADGGTGASTAADARVNLGVDNYGMLKNRIINGAMVISQRGTSFAGLTDGSNSYTLDRWNWQESGTSTAVQTVSQDSSAPAGFINSLKVLTTTAQGTLNATNGYKVNQFIEGLNVADLGWGTANAKTVTLSFWTRSSLTGTFGGHLRNSASNRYYVFSYTINAADTWEYKTITIAGDTTGTWLTTNGLGISVSFSVGTGSDYLTSPGSWNASRLEAPTGQVNVAGTLNATWFVTGVQLEVGTQATSFEYRQYGTELALCYRYYYKIKAASANAPFGNGFNFSTTQSVTVIPFPVSMRIEPTALEQSGTAADYRVLNSSASSVNCSSVPSFATASVDSSQVNTTVSSGLTQGDGTIFRATNTSAYLGWSAEL